MKKNIAVGIVAAIGLVPVSAFAANNDTPVQNNVPAKSERAMAPDAGQTDGSASTAVTGRSAATKSERAMDPASGQAGVSPSPKSERAMDPAKSEK